MSGTAGFREDVALDVNSDNIGSLDPLAPPQHIDFDYDAVEAALGGGSEIKALSRETAAKLGAPLILLQWAASVRLQPGCAVLIGHRALAALWVVRPDMFDGLSQTELSELIGAKNKMEISRHASAFSKVFGVRNRGQAHGWNANSDFAGFDISNISGPKLLPERCERPRRVSGDFLRSRTAGGRLHRNFKFSEFVDRLIFDESSRMGISSTEFIECAVLEFTGKERPVVEIEAQPDTSEADREKAKARYSRNREQIRAKQKAYYQRTKAGRKKGKKGGTVDAD